MAASDRRLRSVDGRARARARTPWRAFSNFKVGAALETADGTIITGCNVENATYGLTDLRRARRDVQGARPRATAASRRIAIVADTDDPTPPCGACRQILWEFGGNLEVIAREPDRATRAPTG